MGIREEIREIPSSAQDLRKFGLTMSAVFGIWAALLFWRGRDARLTVAVLAVFFLFFGLWRPAWLRLAHKAWMSLAVCMGWVMSRVLLTAIFYLVLTPLGLLLKLSGKDLMHKRRDTGGSYWKDHAPRQTSDYENQF